MNDETASTYVRPAITRTGIVAACYETGVVAADQAVFTRVSSEKRVSYVIASFSLSTLAAEGNGKASA